MKVVLAALILAVALVAADDDNKPDVEGRTSSVGAEAASSDADNAAGADDSTADGSTGGSSGNQQSTRFLSPLGGVAVGQVVGQGFGVNPVSSFSPGFVGVSPVVGGVSPVISGVSPLVGGVSPVLHGGSPLVHGVSPLVQGVSPVQVHGVSPLVQGVSPVQLHGVSPLVGGVSPLVGSVSPVVGILSPGVGAVAPPSVCRYWCRTPQGQAYCCENVLQPQSLVGVVKPGQCPPARPVCPPVRNFQPPATCSNDGACGGVDKCCYDTCLEEHVCKPPFGFGR
ncbi:elastin-like [Macrobrachium nipponense]|uniref:elastin-like n=1 Tax=Macrobrachium nipponense TaxID=159736 RepID=UPI0030C7A208